MRKLFSLLAVGVVFTGLALAAEEVTITGDAVCRKCALKETKKCQNVVIVTEGGKSVNYYLKTNKFSKDAHSGLGICQASKDAPVKVKATGTVKEEEGEKVLTPTKPIEKVEE